MKKILIFIFLLSLCSSRDMERKAGILMHISSLPSNYGIGTLGAEAYHFVEFLVNAKQKVWEILPIGPTLFGDSPYQSFSTFAGNPYFIDLDALIQEGLLTEGEVKGLYWEIKILLRLTILCFSSKDSKFYIKLINVSSQ